MTSSTSNIKKNRFEAYDNEFKDKYWQFYRNSIKL